MKKTGFLAEMIESSEQRSTNIFLLILAVECLALQVIGLKTYKEN